ncbi:MAG: hypothetical protein ACR652_24670 [Methylocystis sp.]|uniref:hypothetical protein n=1 Tax=Methylocystis sp. TaxID=1911079 RepID=UPI003DA42B1A
MTLAAQLLETAKQPEVSLSMSVAAIVALGKVWDKWIGSKRDHEFRRYRQEQSKRFDEHVEADQTAFAKINTSLAVLEVGVGTLQKEVSKVHDRMFDQR